MQKLGTVIYFSYFIPSLCFIPSPSDCPQSMFYTDAIQSKAMFTRDRSQMDPTLSWNGPFLFTRYRSAYQRLSTRDQSVIVRY